MRIGINVPNELIDRVKAIRPEVNLSQICREALESRAIHAERAAAQAAADGMNQHVIRFAEPGEAPKTEPDWAGMALEDARDWVLAVDPDRWFDFWQFFDDCQKEGRDVSITAGLYAGELEVKSEVDRIQENTEWFSSLARRASRGDYGHALLKAKEEYNRTWLAYVSKARRMLEEHVNSEHDKQQEKREAAQRNPPEAELPPQMLEYHER